MQVKPMRVGQVYLYAGGLGSSDRALTGVNNVDSVEAAIEASVRTTGDAHVAIIPEGPYVVLVFRTAA